MWSTEFLPDTQQTISHAAQGLLASEPVVQGNPPIPNFAGYFIPHKFR